MPNTVNIIARFVADTVGYRRELDKALATTTNWTNGADRMSEAAKELGAEINNLKLNYTDYTKLLAKFAAGIFIAFKAIKKIIGVTRDWSDAQSELEEIQQKFNVVFRHSRIEVNEWSEEFARSINRNATNVKRFAAQLQNTFVPLGFMREESTELSKALVELAFDIASFNDIPVAIVSKDLQSALLGNIRAVRKYGISANETAIASEALRQGWVKEKSEIDAVIKARAINNIILKATRDSQGDMNRTLHQTANIRREYNDTIQRSKELLGVYVNQRLTPTRKALSLYITKLNEAVAAHINLNKAIKGDLFGVNIESAIDSLKEIIEKRKSILSQIKEAVLSQILQREVETTAQLELQLAMLEGQLKVQGKIEGQTGRNTSLQELALKAQEDAQTMIVARLDILGELENKLITINKEIEVSKVLGKEYNGLQEQSKTIQESIERVLRETNGKELQDAINKHVELRDIALEELIIVEEQLEKVSGLGEQPELVTNLSESLSIHREIVDSLNEELSSMVGLRELLDQILESHINTLDAARIETMEKERDLIFEERRLAIQKLGESEAVTHIQTLRNARLSMYDAFDKAEEELDGQALEGITEIKDEWILLENIIKGLASSDLTMDIVEGQVEAVEALMLKLDALMESLDPDDDIKQAWEDFYFSIGDMAANIFSQISSLMSAMLARSLAEFRWENEQEQRIRDDAYDKEVIRLEDTIADKELLNLAILALDEDRADAEETIAEDLELARRKLAYDGALKAWNLQILASIASGANAVINATASGFQFGGLPLAIIQAAIATTMTGLQIATVSASKPVKNFQTGTRGFTVPEGFNNDSFNVGLTSGERFSVETPTEQIDELTSTPLNIYIMWNHTQVGHVFTKAIRNRDTIIRMEDIVK